MGYRVLDLAIGLDIDELASWYRDLNVDKGVSSIPAKEIILAIDVCDDSNAGNPKVITSN